MNLNFHVQKEEDIDRTNYGSLFGGDPDIEELDINSDDYLELDEETEEKYVDFVENFCDSKWNTSPNGRYAMLKGNCKQRGISLEISENEFIKWIVTQPKKCYYCNTDLTNGTNKLFTTMSINRLNKDVGYNLDNMVLSCLSCARISQNSIIRNINRENIRGLIKQHRESFKTYCYSPEAKVRYNVLKQNSTKRGKIISISLNEFGKWFDSQSNNCFYCGIEMVKGQGVRAYNNITIDRINSKKDYSVDNIVLCCVQCNRTKGDNLSQEEMIKVGKLLKELREIRNLNQEGKQ